MAIKADSWEHATVMEAYYGLVKAMSIGNNSFCCDIVNFCQVNSILAFDTTPSGKL